MESTTSEVITGLRNAAVRKKMKISQETVDNLERVLRQADLVKFAKSKPLDFEIAEDRAKIEKTIFTLHKAIPEVEEEDEELLLLDAQKKELLLKKKRKRKIAIATFIGAFLVVGTLTYFITTRGLDAILGNPTKELYEGEWIKSDYGNPAVTIETPKVLKRTKLPGGNKDMGIKESQAFAYGTVFDEVMVNISTTSFKDTLSRPLEKVVEKEIKSFEKQYKAKDVFVKQDQFDTKEGISGIKAYGTMVVFKEDSDKGIKIGYEIMVFGQEGGLQEIIITYRDNDEYGSKISDRIVNSVELKKVN